MDKQELIKLLDIANQRLRHHHDALWKEETHYTWLLYILVAGVIFIFFINGVCWTLKALIIFFLGIIGISICLIGYSVVRKEGQYFHEAIQIRNRLNCAIGLNQRIKTESDFNKMLIPNSDTKVKDWDRVKSEANKCLRQLLKGIFKPNSTKPTPMGIRDWFQVTLLLPILLFSLMIVLSIIKAFCA
jgi:hypothetical protein